MVAIYLGFWAAVILGFTAHLVFAASFEWRQAVRAALYDWLPWVILSPGVILLTRKFPLERGRLRWSVPVHAVACLTAMVLCGWISQQFLAAPMRGGMELEPRPEMRRPRFDLPPDASPGPPPLAERPDPPSEMHPYEGPPPGPGGPGRRGARDRPLPGSRQFLALVLWARAKLNLPVYWVLVSAVHAFGYYRRVQERDRRALELTASLSKAKLESLRLQMQPHFLFNTLNAISTLVHRSPEMADEMIANLSDLLRLSLEVRDQEVPLSRELELLDAYLAIEKTRLGERLQVKREITPDALQARLPTLVLQTLVENAIRHGIEPKEEGGTVTVTALVDGKTLRVSVEDDGIGLTGAGPATENRGIGLANTESRLAELYGEAGSLVMRAPNTGGIVVEMTVPLRNFESTDTNAEARSSSSS